MAVYVNGSAFEHDPPIVPDDLADRSAEQLRDRRGCGIVALPVRILGPAVKMPIGERDLARRLDDKDGTIISCPDAVGRDMIEIEPGDGRSGLAQHALDPLLGLGIIDEDADDFALSQLADNFGVHPGDRREFAGPIRGVMRPGDPSRPVRLPLGGHTDGIRHLSIVLCHRSLCRTMTNDQYGMSRWPF